MPNFFDGLMLKLILQAGLCAVVVPCFAQVAVDHAEEPAAASAIRDLGGTARRLSESSSEWEVAFHLGGRDLTDRGLADVVKLDGIVSLNLRDTKITGAGLSHLGRLKDLRVLHLERTAIDDAGVAKLAALTQLEYLNLYGTEVTDKGLSHLSALTKLKRLYVWQTKITDQGADQLEKQLPDLKINRGVDLNNLPTYEDVVDDRPEPKIDLKWNPVSRVENAPKSENGVNTEVVFENKSGQPVKLYWISYGNEPTFYATLEVDANRRQNSYARNTWLVTDENEKPLGYFVVGEELARAVIPKE